MQLPQLSKIIVLLIGLLQIINDNFSDFELYSSIFHLFDSVCLSVAMTTASFSTLSLMPALLQSVESLAYTHMTPIQQQSLPAMLQGKDIIAKAKTGSGKTVAFSLALLSKINTNFYHFFTFHFFQFSYLLLF